MRAWPAYLLLPACLSAQLQLAVLEQGRERPVGDLLDLGALDASDWMDTRFQVRNAGTAPAVLQTVSVAGTGFAILTPPALPATLTAGGTVSFTVRFQPRAPGAFSAILTVNAATVLLRATATPGAVLWLEGGAQRVKLSAGDTVDFGAVQRGVALRRRFILENPYPTAVTIWDLAVSGPAFQGPEGLELPVELGPQRSAAFDVVFAPQSEGDQTGRLRVGGRLFSLTGKGLAPALPKPMILVDPAAPRSGQQVKVTVRLASVAPTGGTGELRLRFEPAVPGAADDPAIQFLSPAGRVVPLSVEPGEEAARIAGRTEIPMQTGTTAGRVILTAQLGPHTEEAVLPLAALPVALDSIRVLRNTGALELNLAAFDNTRSVAQLVFTFYDRQGRPVEPGAIAVDASAEFRRYFESSAAGGLFALRAVFPVSGDLSAISGLEVELKNSAGVARSARVSF